MGEPLFKGVVVSLGSNIRDSRPAKCQDLVEYLLTILLTVYMIFMYKKSFSLLLKQQLNFKLRGLSRLVLKNRVR